jgi:UMF1 family MFS transporter
MSLEGKVKLDDKKSILAWSLYDWANSAFSTTVAAGFFPIFFKAYWAFGEESIISVLGYANSIASLIVAIMAPFLGAIADRMSGKKKFLFFFAYLGLIMTGGLWLLQAGMWPYAIAFFVTATVGFSGANIFYDALLPGVASEKKIDYVSSLGFALGYIGGGLLFAVNVLMYIMPDLFGFQNYAILPDGTLIPNPMGIRVSFLSVAIWWAVFSIPIFIFVKEPKLHKKVGFGTAIKLGLRQIAHTFREIKALKWVLIFLFGYWFYIDGVDTVIAMAVAIGDDLGFDQSSLIIALLMVQFIAFPGTLAYNWFSKKIGIKWGILIAILAYCGLVIFGFFMTTVTHFFILAALIGPFQGGIQALSRSFYSRLTPATKSGEFFGFYNMLGKFAAVLGPLLMAIVRDATGSTRYSILSILILFIIGGVLFISVNQKEGERLAKEYLAKPINE